MKKICSLAGLLFACSALFGQVGIGTQTPNARSILELSSSSKGLLLPRMTASERAAMSLTSIDAGMMVFQTTSPKGMYTWDGTGWIFSAPVDAGALLSTTLRWDVTTSKWVAASNIYNGGGSIGINTGSAPNYQLQLTSQFSNTRLQLTSSNFGITSGDGLILGINNNVVSSSAGLAYLLNQESKPLWFGTWGQERMRIDSVGHVGINTTDATAYLDVNGSFKLGTNGSELQSIMHMDYEVDPPAIAAFAEWICDIPCPNTSTNAVVYVSPGATMDHIMVGYARVNTAGNVQVKLMNMSSNPIDISTVMLHIAVIQ